MTKKANFITFSTILLLLSANISSADTLYLNNGHKMQGKVQKVDGGVWFEGMFFSDSEVKSIEKAKPKPVKKKSWMEQIQDRFKPKPKPEEKKTNTPHPQQRAAKKIEHKKPSKGGDFIASMIMGGDNSHVSQGMGAFEDRMNASTAAMEQAMEIQKMVNQQQAQMQMQMMQAYGEGFTPEEMEAMGIMPEDLMMDPEAIQREAERYQERMRSNSRSNSNSNYQSDYNRSSNRSSYGQGSSRSSSRSPHKKKFRSKNIGAVSDNIGRTLQIGPQ